MWRERYIYEDRGERGWESYDMKIMEDKISKLFHLMKKKRTREREREREREKEREREREREWELYEKKIEYIIKREVGNCMTGKCYIRYNYNSCILPREKCVCVYI